MTAIPTMAHAIRQVLDRALGDDPAVVLLGDSVGRFGGAAGTCAGLRAIHGSDRVLDLPIADRGTVGFAVGLALGGKRPVVELAGAGRLPAVLEVLGEAARIAGSGGFPVPLVVRVPFGSDRFHGTGCGIDMPTGEALPRVPGLHVVAPSDATQARELLDAALRADHPTVVLESRVLYGRRHSSEGGRGFGARVLREGEHVTLAAWGDGVGAAEAAADALHAEGISAGLIDLVSLWPLDTDTLGAALRTTGRLVAVHPDDPSTAHAARLVGLDEAFLYLRSPLAHSVAHPDRVARAARAAVHY